MTLGSQYNNFQVCHETIQWSLLSILRRPNQWGLYENHVRNLYLVAYDNGSGFPISSFLISRLEPGFGNKSQTPRDPGDFRDWDWDLFWKSGIWDWDLGFIYKKYGIPGSQIADPWFEQPSSEFFIERIKRITKYQLLLDQMVKYSARGDEELQRRIKEALGGMLKCVRAVNDSLQNITGYQVPYHNIETMPFSLEYSSTLP